MQNIHIYIYYIYKYNVYIIYFFDKRNLYVNRASTCLLVSVAWDTLVGRAWVYGKNYEKWQSENSKVLREVKKLKTCSGPGQNFRHFTSRFFHAGSRALSARLPLIAPVHEGLEIHHLVDPNLSLLEPQVPTV